MKTPRMAALGAVLGLLAVGTAGASSSGSGRIAFASERTGSYQLYLMDADGSNETRLTYSTALDQNPAWAPDGQHLLFDSDEQSDADLYTIRLDGTGRTRLTTSGNAYGARYSPDGARIAFQGVATGGAGDVLAMAADGSDLVNVTGDPHQDEYPSWSPDGTRILFDSDRDGDFDLYTVAPDGSGVTQLTSNTADDVAADWSPDGTRIAFVSSRSGSWEIWTMGADGSSPVQVTSRGEVWGPSWTADGTRILFQGATPDGAADLFSVNADGSGLVQLTDAPGYDVWARTAPAAAPSAAAYLFAGFFKPVDNAPVLNVMNAGRTIPLTFSLGGDFGLDVLAAGSPRSQQVACDTNAPLSTIEGTTSSSASALTYATGTDTYAYRWKTEAAWAGTCRRLDLAFDDGSTHSVTFWLR